MPPAAGAEVASEEVVVWLPPHAASSAITASNAASRIAQWDILTLVLILLLLRRMLFTPSCVEWGDRL
jgi:hypothetical protein